MFNKRLLSLLVVLLSGLSLMAQEIHSLDVDIYLEQNGGAKITQLWDVTVESGTEFYTVFNQINGIVISDFTVKEGNRLFDNISDNWDVDQSMEDKAFRCGTKKIDATWLELCWGIGSYGRHTWTVSFALHDLVHSFNECDACMLNVIPKLGNSPKSSSLTIHGVNGEPLKEDYTSYKMWGCTGFSQLCDDGTIYFEKEQPQKDDYLSLYMSFEKGHFYPSLSHDMDFASVLKSVFPDDANRADTQDDKKNAEKESAGDVTSFSKDFSGYWQGTDGTMLHIPAVKIKGVYKCFYVDERRTGSYIFFEEPEHAEKAYSYIVEPYDENDYTLDNLVFCSWVPPIFVWLKQIASNNIKYEKKPSISVTLENKRKEYESEQKRIDEDGNKNAKAVAAVIKNNKWVLGKWGESEECFFTIKEDGWVYAYGDKWDIELNWGKNGEAYFQVVETEYCIDWNEQAIYTVYIDEKESKVQKL